MEVQHGRGFTKDKVYSIQHEKNIIQYIPCGVLCTQCSIVFAVKLSVCAVVREILSGCFFDFVVLYPCDSMVAGAE